MSTIAQPPVIALPPVQPVFDLYRMTVDEYDALAAAGVLTDTRVELLDGLLVRKMTKKAPHAVALTNLVAALIGLGLKDWCVRIQDPIRLPPNWEPEPDLVIARAPSEQYNPHHPGPGSIGLVVEISEASLPIDQGVKCAAYACNGIPVYWIVNLVDHCLEVHSEPASAAGTYARIEILKPGQSVPVILDGSERGRIDVAALIV